MHPSALQPFRRLSSHHHLTRVMDKMNGQSKIGGHLSSPMLLSLPLRVGGDSQYFLKKSPSSDIQADGREGNTKGIAWRCREEERQDHDPRCPFQGCPSQSPQHMHYFQTHVIERLNSLIWKGPLKAIWSNVPAVSRVTYSSIGCSEHHPA